MTGSIKPNVVNEIKKELGQIAIEKNDNEIKEKMNDEILDFLKKEVEEEKMMMDKILMKYLMRLTLKAFYMKKLMQTYLIYQKQKRIIFFSK